MRNRLNTACLAAAVLLLAAPAGCLDRPLVGEDGPSARRGMEGELVEFQHVRWARPTGEVQSGYFKRYRLRGRGQSTYWVDIFNPLHQQVGLVDESGLTYRWTSEEKRWRAIGSYPHPAGVAAVLSVPPGEMKLDPVLLRLPGGAQ